MLTTYKWIICTIGFIVSALLLSAALANFARVRKKHYSNYGGAMCTYMLIAGIVIAALSGYFIAM